MSLGERINTIRKEKKISLDELVEKSGVPKGTLSKITAGITTNPTLDTVQAIAKALGCRLDDFDDTPINKKSALSIRAQALAVQFDRLDDHGKKVVKLVADEETARISEESADDEPLEILDIKRYLAPVSAGDGIDLYGLDSVEFITVIGNVYTRRADFCLTVAGHSMEPRYSDGDLILARKQDDVDFGEIGIWIVDNKGYMKVKGEGCLISLNPNVDDVYLGEFDDCKCVAKVIGVLDPDWIVESR